MFDLRTLAAAAARLRSKQIFFLCGAPKSGTTWLQVLLDAHPSIVCNGEGHFCDQLLPALHDALANYNGMITAKNRTIFGDLRGYPLFRPEHELYLLATAMSLSFGEQADDPALVAIGEKSPDNIRFLPVLDRLFPRAKFIHIIRDGRDGAVSCWFHNQRLTPDWVSQNFATMDDFVARYAQEWEQAVRAGREFAAQRPGHFLEVRYEDMIADTPAVAMRVFAFLGVAADDDRVRDCCARGSFEALSHGRARGEEDRGSFFRKGAVGDWRLHLSAAAVQHFERTAGDWLARLGYQRVS
jgi:hypothetical protein